MKLIISFINNVLNLIYPNVCGICNRLCKDDLCKKCETNLNKIAKFKVDYYSNKHFKKHFYIFKYQGIIKEKLIDFKFNEKSYVYKAFVNFMLKNKKFYDFLKSYDIIIPVPIHNNRKLKRGYNQSSLIAKELAYSLDILYKDNVLIKKINNKPQSTKNKNDRKQNVIGAYAVRNSEKIINKKILILDDVYTTGSTAGECAKVLKNAGAKWVDVVTIAKD